MEKREKQLIYTGIVFTIFFFLLMRNIVNASLWLDEGVEYWFSKSIHAVLPGESTISTMYERIIRTYQPPLYNVLMYIWLRIDDTELWFKLFGVVMGVGAGVAVFKTIQKAVNTFVALISVLILANVYRFVYYVQECAEYNLMLLNICWMLFFFVTCIQDFSKIKVWGFTFFAVLAVYSQYGAVFIAAGFAIILFVYALVRKQKKEIKAVSFSYVAAGIFGALPLYIFFAKSQIARQIDNTAEAAKVNAEEGWITSFINGMKDVIEYNFIPNNLSIRWAVCILLTAAFVMTVWLIVKKDRIITWYTIASLTTYSLYFLLVRIGVYGHGYFNNRYALFLLPMFFVEIVMVIGRFYILFKSDAAIKKDAVTLVYGIIIGGILVYSILGYRVIGNGWTKEDTRDMFKYWYMETPKDAETFVYYGAVPVFSFYMEHEEEYVPGDIINQSSRNVVLQPDIRNAEKEEYKEYILSVYEGEIPSEIYFVGSHYITEDYDVMLEVFNELGYSKETLWEKTQAKIVRLTR